VNAHSQLQMNSMTLDAARYVMKNPAAFAHPNVENSPDRLLLSPYLGFKARAWRVVVVVAAVTFFTYAGKVSCCLNNLHGFNSLVFIRVSNRSDSIPLLLKF